jgi:hypothetical protein
MCFLMLLKSIRKQLQQKRVSPKIPIKLGEIKIFTFQLLLDPQDHSL